MTSQEGDPAGRASRAQWRAQPRSARTATYRATWDERTGVLSVEAELTAAAGGRLSIEPELRGFFEDIAAAPAREPWAWQAPAAVEGKGERGESILSLAPCRSGPCRLRYRVALRAAAERLDDISWAGLYRGLLVAPPSTWILAPAPEGPAWAQRLAFSVATARGERFATGLPRSADGSAWEIELRDLWTSPYAVFGELRLVELRIGAAAGAVATPLWVAISGEPALGDDELARWVERSAGAVAGYWGRFPMSDALIVLAGAPGGRIGGGRTLSGGGGAVVLGVGERVTPAELARDWVLVHELVHLGFPSMPRHQRWAEEGIATYVEPIARVRAGLLDERDAWRSLMDGLPHGVLRRDDPGLDGTRTWGATYWGGALFWLLGDLELRRKSNNAKGLEHALAGVLAAPGGNNGTRWPLVDVLDLGDRAAAPGALGALYAQVKDRAHPVDLPRLWRDLGLVVEGDTVTFDDDAPMAAIRRAIMAAPR